MSDGSQETQENTSIKSFHGPHRCGRGHKTAAEPSQHLLRLPIPASGSPHPPSSKGSPSPAFPHPPWNLDEEPRLESQWPAQIHSTGQSKNQKLRAFLNSMGLCHRRQPRTPGTVWLPKPEFPNSRRVYVNLRCLLFSLFNCLLEFNVSTTPSRSFFLWSQTSVTWVPSKGDNREGKQESRPGR